MIKIVIMRRLLFLEEWQLMIELEGSIVEEKKIFLEVNI